MHQCFIDQKKIYNLSFFFRIFKKMRTPIYRINFNLYHHYNSFHVSESLRTLYKIPRNSSINFQKTFFSTNKQDKSNNNSNNNVETKQLIFEGPNFRLIRILKIFSISTFGVRIKN